MLLLWLFLRFKICFRFLKKNLNNALNWRRLSPEWKQQMLAYISVTMMMSFTPSKQRRDWRGIGVAEVTAAAVHWQDSLYKGRLREYTLLNWHFEVYRLYKNPQLNIIPVTLFWHDTSKLMHIEDERLLLLVQTRIMRGIVYFFFLWNLTLWPLAQSSQALTVLWHTRFDRK